MLGLQPAERRNAARCALASCSDAGAEPLGPRLRSRSASFRAAEDWGCGGADVGPLDLVRLSDFGWEKVALLDVSGSSKHTEHGVLKPSVTIKGVGP